MKHLIIPATAATLFAFVCSANAATITGTIKSIDAAKDMITLSDGSVYTASPKVKVAQFKVGEKVKVIFEKEKGKLEASGLMPAA